jgi:hypothetical protein
MGKEGEYVIGPHFLITSDDIRNPHQTLSNPNQLESRFNLLLNLSIQNNIQHNMSLKPLVLHAHATGTILSIPEFIHNL